MENSNEKFLDFNGKSIYFKSFDGQWWIAIKPICEALNVDYIQQFKNLKDDKILNGVLCNHTIHDASFRLQKMVCLPEKFVYGWLFKIRSSSVELLEFQWECYKILFDHFHGAITQRSETLKTKTKAELRIEEIQRKFSESPEGQELSELKAVVKKESSNLRKLDIEFITTQMELWDSEVPVS